MTDEIHSKTMATQNLSMTPLLIEGKPDSVNIGKFDDCFDEVDYISEPSQGPESCRGVVSPKEKMSLYQIKKPNMNKSRAHSIYSK